MIFSPTRFCLKNIISSSRGNHQADRKREAYDPGSIVLKNCIIIRSLEGDSSGCVLDQKREAYNPGSIVLKDCIILRSLEGDSSGCALDRSIAQLSTSDGREFARITLESNGDSRVLHLAQ